MNEEIYLDGASNTPLSADVLRAMEPFLTTDFVGNSKAAHGYGIEAGVVVERARQQIADDLCVPTNAVLFTSGATEGNNWVIKSYAIRHLLRHDQLRGTILCCATEHSSVYNSCKQVSEWGMNVQYVPADDRGAITAANVEPYLSSDVALLCVMAVNNETGVANEVSKITSMAYKQGIATLVDCTQALSCGGECVEIGLRYPAATFMTFSAHKIYGPTGCGCLISRRTEDLEPLIMGGAQELGLRGGTTNTVGVVGMAAAVHAIHSASYTYWFTHLRDYLVKGIKEMFPDAKIIEADHPNITSINLGRYFNQDFDQLAAALSAYGIAVSAGSACDAQHDETAGDFNGSHVLLALGLLEHDIRCTIRVSFVKDTTEVDIDALLNAIKEVYEWDQEKS